MNIVVCAKQVPDTEKIKIDKKTGSLLREGVPSILNPADACALEWALRYKDADPEGTQVIVVSMGPEQAKDLLFECICMGADKGILLSDKRLKDSDTQATANALCAVIQALDVEEDGGISMVLCGTHTTDGATAQVGPELAEFLGYPQVTNVTGMSSTGGLVQTLTKERLVVDVPMPALLTVGEGVFEPRFMYVPSIFDEMCGEDSKIHTWNMDEIGLFAEDAGLDGSPTKVLASFAMQGDAKGRMVDCGSARDDVAFVLEDLKNSHKL